MQPEHLLTVATLLALVWSFGAVFALLRRIRRPGVWRVVNAGISLGGLAGVLWLHSILVLGRNAFVYLVDSLASGDLHHVCAAGLGACVGFAPAVWPWQYDARGPAAGWSTRLLRAAGLASVVGTFLFLSLLTMQEQIEPYVKRRSLASIIANPLGYSRQSDVVLDEFHECDFYPLQLAIGPDGNVYATGYAGAAYQHGLVMRISVDSETGLTQETQVARSLGRPHGLAFYNGDLYVSRCGQYARAEAGTLVGVNTGAVTQLRDLDGDGIMDYYHDIVSELPGAQGPDPLHQNNGITFAADGTLYITVGAHADRAPTVHPFEGTILRARADGSGLEVFSRGLRNPFDIAVGPDGQPFCTDNDCSDRRNGDELNHLIENGHYGYPYADGSQPHPEGSVPPLLVTRSGTYQGIAYADSPRLPAAYRNCLYLVSYGNGDIYRVRLQRDGASYTAEASLFARVPGALDIAVDNNGVFYVSCFHTRKIYRLRPQELLP